MKRLVVLILVTTTFLFSCSDNDRLENPAIQESNQITEALAFEISKNLAIEQIASQATGRSQPSKKEINEFTAVNDEEGKSLFYITNYKEGGFVILSADNRLSPILAYSETSKFRTTSEEYSTGLIEWLSVTKDAIQSVRRQKVKQSPAAKKEWDAITLKKIEPEPTTCENEYEQVGPLLTTNWDQNCGYNDFMPAMSCSVPCGRAYAGCVPVAIAQVMKFHNYPTSYNWANMPDNFGTTTTASFIRDIHNALTINIFGTTVSAVSYDCDGTGVDKDYNTAGVFTNKFGYSTASQGGYNYETVKQQLRWRRPVILGGGRKSGWWIFSSYKDGHMWVCDGFRRSFLWSEDCSMGWGYLYLHMNWGWGGYENGWYAFNNFNPDSYTFNYEVKMVYNIKP